jgi:hypothetical protein
MVLNTQTPMTIKVHIHKVHDRPTGVGDRSAGARGCFVRSTGVPARGWPEADAQAREGAGEARRVPLLPGWAEQHCGRPGGPPSAGATRARGRGAEALESEAGREEKAGASPGVFTK